MEVSAEARTLLFDKHVEYIANHGSDKNDYVSISTISARMWNFVDVLRVLRSSAGAIGISFGCFDFFSTSTLRNICPNSKFRL